MFFWNSAHNSGDSFIKFNVVLHINFKFDNISSSELFSDNQNYDRSQTVKDPKG